MIVTVLIGTSPIPFETWVDKFPISLTISKNIPGAAGAAGDDGDDGAAGASTPDFSFTNPVITVDTDDTGGALDDGGDLASADISSQAFTKADVNAGTTNMSGAIHLADYLVVSRKEVNSLRWLDININGTKKVLDAAVNSGINKIVFASSSEVYGEPLKNPIDEDAIGETLSINRDRRRAIGMRFSDDWNWNPWQGQFILWLE